MFEREWLWHLVWGRTAYDPETPERVWTSEFDRRFGPQAGSRVYKAVVEGSKIVPFIYSYHNVGLDHQDFAPEFETGDHAFGAPERVWQGHRQVPYGGNNDDFLRVAPLDRTAMADSVTYVDAFLKNLVSGKMSPYKAADYLDSATDATHAAIEEAAGLKPASPKEFGCIRLDMEALAWLGRYYCDRIRSVTHLEFYHRTCAHPELTQAYADLQKAVTDWDRLSEVTEEHSGYVPEVVRMGVNQFRWRDEGRSLGVDLRQIDDLETAFLMSPRDQELSEITTTLGHTPLFKVRPGEPLPITATYANQDEHGNVVLFYRNSSVASYKRLALHPDNATERTWAGVIPAEEILPGNIEYYFQADLGPFGPYGSTLVHRPPYKVTVSSHDAAPVISPTPPPSRVRGASVTLSVDVQAKGKVSSVSVYYKQMPSPYEWLKVEMEPRGGTSYSASVPLSPEGLLYYFEAIDEDGNGTNYPDFLERTPYLTIDGWDPAQAFGEVRSPLAGDKEAHGQ